VGETNKLEAIAAVGFESSVKPDGVGDNTHLDWEGAI